MGESCPQGAVSSLEMHLVLGHIQQQAEQASEQHSSLVSASVPAFWFLVWILL